MTAEQIFQGITDDLLKETDVTLAAMFGAPGLRSGGRVFAFLWKHRLVVKLPEARVEQLVSGEGAERVDPGHGRVSREWVAVEPGRKRIWPRLVREAREFVARGPGKPSARTKRGTKR